MRKKKEPMQVPALDKQLRDAGCTKIYREKVTGARADRRELLKLFKHLAAGDGLGGRDACRTRAQLPRGQEHDFEAHSKGGMT